jgi:hypothetical protein
LAPGLLSEKKPRSISWFSSGVSANAGIEFAVASELLIVGIAAIFWRSRQKNGLTFTQQLQ